jgi:hypothetical protein
VRAFVSLGGLSPDDVSVQLLSGRVDSDDRLEEPRVHEMEAVEQYEQNRWKFAVALDLERNGPFGYTARVLPRHPGLITPVELGLQAVPDAGAGMTDGPLR